VGLESVEIIMDIEDRLGSDITDEANNPEA
jgi:acyl carrier protein